jgi:hypothetical protein
MPSFLELGICFLLFLPGGSEDVGWIWSLHGDFDEDDGGDYGVSNFLGMSDIEAGTMLMLSWNNFL